MKKIVFMVLSVMMAALLLVGCGNSGNQALFSIGLVLFVFIMMINILLNVFIKGKKA